MGYMKALAIEIGLDVAGEYCERDLLRAPRGETPAARWRRLAQLAIVRGCQLVTVTDEHGDICAAVTSGTRPNVAYKVNVEAMTCQCPAEKPCSHLAYALLCVGNIPTPEPPAGYVARAEAVAKPMAETLAAARTCTVCGGGGWVDAPSTICKDGIRRAMCPVCHPRVRLVTRGERAKAAA